MKMTKILIYIKMLKMILFHHHSSIQDKDWSKPVLGGCAQILVLYTTNNYHRNVLYHQLCTNTMYNVHSN